MTDDVFLQTILRNPGDDGLRLVYADWLEDQGDPRAEYLRIEATLAHRAPAELGHHDLLTRLREACVNLDPGWLAAVSRVPIENCGVSFQFRCPLRWEQLQPTKDGDVRFCESCRKKVYYCSSLELAQAHAAVGECIAIDPRLARRPGDLESDVWDLDSPVMGMALSDEEPEK
jgi:uncharacterized protein (TIGR02996 family)